MTLPKALASLLIALLLFAFAFACGNDAPTPNASDTEAGDVVAMDGGSDTQSEDAVETDTVPEDAHVEDANADDVTTERPDDISELLAEALAETDLPALGGLAGDASGVLAIGVAGVRDVDGALPVTVDDLWHLGSDTKSMTATLAATFVEEGLVAWDTTLPELFPELGDAIHEDFATVTLEMLLAHQAGLTPSIAADVPDWWGAAFADVRDVRVLRAELVATLLTRRATGTAGEFEYSNAGYIVAGAALERIADASWESLMQERIFDPLGMASCGFGPPAGAGETQPSGHASGMFGRLNPVGEGMGSDNPPALGPAGTVHCSMTDWASYLRAHATRSGVISGASYERIQSVVAEDAEYGLGWGVTQRPWGGEVLVHAGSNTLWFAITWVAPETGHYYLAVTNAGNGEASATTDALIGALIEAYPARP